MKTTIKETILLVKIVINLTENTPQIGIPNFGGS